MSTCKITKFTSGYLHTRLSREYHAADPVVYIVSTLFPTISLSFTAFRLSLNYQPCTTTADFSISLVYLVISD